MLPGGNISLKFKQLDPKIKFSEQHLFSGEDTDFNNKLQRNNETLGYFEGLDIPHQPQLSFKGLLAKALQQGRTKSSLEEPTSNRTMNIQLLWKIKLWPPEYLLALFVYLPLVYFNSYRYGRRSYAQASSNS